MAKHLFCIDIPNHGPEAFLGGDYSAAEVERILAVVADQFPTPPPYAIDLANSGRPQVELDGAMAEWVARERQLLGFRGNQDALGELLTADSLVSSLMGYDWLRPLYKHWLLAKDTAKVVDAFAAAKAEQSKEKEVRAKPRKRKRKVDPKAKEKRAARQEQQKADKQLSEAWAGGMGRHKTKADLAREKGMKEKDAKNALERHRKRLERAGKKRPKETPQVRARKSVRTDHRRQSPANQGFFCRPFGHSCASDVSSFRFRPVQAF